MTDAAYKYCDRRGLDILQNLELKITPPNQFNDPFEFVPHVICSNPSREIKTALKDKDTLREMYDFEKRAGRFRGNFRQYRVGFKKASTEFASSLIEEYPSTRGALQRDFQNRLSESMGVLCMSSHRTSILMWGHYCDKHRGLVIGFDKSYEVFQQDMGLQPVKYQSERPIYDTSWKRGGKQEAEFRKLALLKNIEWRYESELRQMFMLRGLKKGRLDDTSIGYFVPFTPTAIVSVTLGAKASKDFENAVRATLAQPKFSHVLVERARLHKSEFCMEFV